MYYAEFATMESSSRARELWNDIHKQLLQLHMELLSDPDDCPITVKMSLRARDLWDGINVALEELRTGD